MISLDLWRARIGSFHRQFAGLKKVKETKDMSTHVKLWGVSDVFTTYLCWCFMAVFFHAFKYLIVNACLSPFSNFIVQGTFEVGTLSAVDVSLAVPNPDLPWIGLPLFCNISTVILFLLVNHRFSFWKLTLSNDVEKNPGPSTNAMAEKKMQETVSTLEDKLSDRISSLEKTLEKQISLVLEAVRNQDDILQKIQENQRKTQDTVSQLCNDMSETIQVVKKNSADIQELKKGLEETNMTVTELQDEIDRLEMFSRRNNVKFFGIPEDSEENPEICAEKVRNVIQTYIVDKTFENDVIERAHRIGKPNPHNTRPRPMIVKFQRWGDAMNIMKNQRARTEMAKKGLKIAQDLTRRQATQLKRAKEEGKIAYFFKGKLHVRPQTEHTDRRPVHVRDSSQETTRKSHRDAVNAQPIQSSTDVSGKGTPHSQRVPHEVTDADATYPTDSRRGSKQRQSTLRSAWSTSSK